MQESSTKGTNHPSVLQFRRDLEIQLREQVRDAIETVLNAELSAALGSARHERTERREGERYAVLFLDGFHLKVRLAKRVVAVPVLAALGVLENGQKRLIALQLAATEATASEWTLVRSATPVAYRHRCLWSPMGTRA